MKGSSLTGADADGNIMWRAEAEVVDLDEAAEQAVLTGVECSFLESGKTVSRYRAGKMTAHFEEGARRLLFAEGVTAESLVSQATAAFDRATYLWDEQRLVDAVPVELTKANTRLSGRLLEGDIALRRVRVEGGPARLRIR